MKSIQNINELLINAGIKPSLQRIKIMEFLQNNNIHPTVEIIYNELLNEMPTLSKTTIYNTLKLFEQNGVINSVTIDENELRYDGFTSVHGHFKCLNCAKIYDFNYNSDDLKFKGLSKFKIKQTEINLKGICPECKNKNLKLY